MKQVQYVSLFSRTVSEPWDQSTPSRGPFGNSLVMLQPNMTSDARDCPVTGKSAYCQLTRPVCCFVTRVGPFLLLVVAGRLGDGRCCHGADPQITAAAIWERLADHHCTTVAYPTLLHTSPPAAPRRHSRAKRADLGEEQMMPGA
jgi:hypothetical protein